MATTTATTEQPSASGPRLTAAYTSPTNDPFTLDADPLPSASSLEPSTQQKSAHLAALRAAATKMQDDINAHLTQRMDEDNKRAAAVANKDGKQADEAVEEDNYGEEVVDEED
ncbi:hypothetical protein Micbo1qcDRAFT_236575 [Microdochium bolleyi]|uniref:EKC/KEOPS complex subunit GON7 n=1 Tax=Microdochium bolleyi TaxID=196109 RepID=A0A136IQE2_9PEZI|nr:hypothetical protein Micbo1qcDRAFT_236575 [Microdochium bolleyi]